MSNNSFSINEIEDDLGLNHFNDVEEDDFSDIFDFDSSHKLSSTSALIANNEDADSKIGFSDLHEEVEKLGVEEVRWFYQSSGKKKKWKAFVGSDSLKIEQEWRKLSISTYEACRVCVRGGMHEVDVVEKKCFPVYWSTENGHGEIESLEIIRGTWFYDNGFIPLPENLANRIEVEHLERWKDLNIKDIKDMHGHKVMHSVKLQGCHVDWNSVTDVFLHSDAAQYRALRNIVQRFGVSKTSTTGTRLRRGYMEDAMHEDCVPPVEHLVFVVHGIGAKPDRQKIVRNTNSLRNACSNAEAKYFIHSTKRVEFLPVEWRCNLKLDGGLVSTITPKKAHGMRQFLNNNAMDILYYTSPLYRSEIVDGLRKEISKLYKMFIDRNPSFSGKVSIFAHSLGSVIIHDIMTDWQPEALYEKYLMVKLKKDTESMEGLLTSQPTSMEYLQRELEKIHAAQKEVTEIKEELLHAQVDRAQISTSSFNPGFNFKVENFFCVGSPLAVFLTLRGFSPSNGTGTQLDVIPPDICNRIFNIFHPADPVAYRIEPLILPHYSGIAPLQIHWHAAVLKTPYNEIKAKTYTENNAMEMQSKSLPNEEDLDNSSDTDNETDEIKYDTISEAKDNATNFEGSNEKQTSLIDTSVSSDRRTSYLESALRVGRGIWSRRKTSDSEKEGDEVVKSPDRSNSSSPLPDSLNSVQSKSSRQVGEDQQESLSNLGSQLEHRIDYELMEGFTESRLGYASLTAHTSYWGNADLALFILMQIHPSASMVQSIQPKS